MQAVSNEFKELAKSNARISLAKFVIKDSNTEVDGETIIDGFIEEMTCDNTSLVGNVMAKNLETNIYNNFTNDFIGKEIFAYTGQVLEDGTEEYVPRGTFIIDESEEDVSSGSLKLKGFDYTIKMNVAWEDPLDWENNTYTLGDFAKAVCEFCDLELETEEFSNSDYVLTEQPAFEGYQCRYVMQRIAEIATSNVFISPEDKVQIRLAPQNYVSAEGSSITLEESANSKLKIDEFEGETTQATSILPSGYTQVEYIRQNRLQSPYSYLDTNIALGNNFKIECEFVLNGYKAQEQPIVSTFNTTNNYFNLFVRPNSAGTNANLLDLYVKGHHNLSSTAIQLDIKNNVIIERNGDNWNTNLNGTTSSFTNTTLADNSTTLKAFVRGDNVNGASINLCKLKIYTSNTLVRNLIPCYRVSDNVVGMYDLTNGVFYSNANAESGNFTKGNNVSIPNPNYPQDIHVVSGDNEINICGKNLFNVATSTAKKYVNKNTGNIGNSNDWSASDFIPIAPNTTYRFSGITQGWSNIAGQVFYDENKNYISSVASNTYTITTPSNAKYVRLSINSETPTSAMLEVGSTATTYEPYMGNTYPIYLGVENLFPSTLFTSSTINGVTFTNNNGAITLNGTSTSAYTGLVLSTHFTLKAGTYQFNCDNQTSQYYAQFYDNTNKLYRTSRAGAFTITTDIDVYNFGITIPTNGTSINNVTLYPQLELGTKANHFTPYGADYIKLCKIETYKDKIYKGEGYNLFDGETELGSYSTSTGSPEASTTVRRNVSSISVLPNKNYTFSRGGTALALRVYYYKVDNTFIGTEVKSNGQFTTPNECYKVNFISDQIVSNYNQLMINEGTTALPYEPYNAKGKWYLHKEINKIVLDGSETWNRTYVSGSGSPCYWSLFTTLGLPIPKYEAGSKICNYFPYEFKTWTQSSTNTLAENNANDLSLLFNVDSSIANTISEWNTWLSTHSVIVYYVLATPTNTEITSSNYPELYSQLKAIDKARTIDGLTNIESSIPISFQYDEKVVEDIDINSIMSLEVEDTSYKPYNAVTLALADGIEGENVTLRDEDSIALYGERALVITANEFAINQAVREELIKEMFNSINGFNYVPMKLEYNSYDWLERFDRIKVQYDDDKYYETYLFNHTTEFPSTIKSVIENVAINETNTKYEFIPETQQRGTHTEIVVDKLNGTITSTVSRIDDADSDIKTLKTQYTNVSQDFNSIKTTVEAVQENYDDLSNAGFNETQRNELAAIESSMKTYIDTEIDRVTTTVTKTGGNNRIRNSVGFKGIDYWTLSEGGTATTSQSTDVEQSTISGSEIILTQGTLRADYTTIVGGTYTVSFKFKKTSVGAANVVKMELHKSEDDYITLYEGSEDFSDWNEITHTYQATTATPYLIFDCGGDRLEISDLIANDGEQQSWSQYFDEVYGKTHQLDTSGLSLQAENSDETSHLDNNNLIFEKSGTIRGELSGDRVKSDTAEITTTIKIGEFTYQVIDSNNMTLY